MSTGIVAVPVNADARPGPLIDGLRGAVADGPAIAPYAAGDPPPQLAQPGAGAPDDLALVVSTSGSTGTPKRAMLSARALRASAEATHARIGGEGTWLLAMPAVHIAGIQVISRSLIAGNEPHLLDLTRGFSPDAFAEATERLVAEPGRHYTSLVPTQLTRLLSHVRGREALTAYDAVLVGGAATAPRLMEQAGVAEIRVVRTYGMSETAGGCVYDGVPLDGVTVRTEDDERVVLSGPMLAHGYLGNEPATREAFVTDADGTRWFRTDDLGTLTDGRLSIHGRADDFVNTGGLKVAPGVVEDAIVRHVEEVQEAVVVGVPDPEWGEAVAAAVTLRPGARPPAVADVRAVLRMALEPAALPRRLAVVDAIPLRGPGKPDRRAVKALFADEG